MVNAPIALVQNKIPQNQTVSSDAMAGKVFPSNFT